MPSVLWCCRLGGWKGIRPVKKTEWWGAGVVICLERGAHLHTAQLIPLPLTVSCFSILYCSYSCSERNIYINVECDLRALCRIQPTGLLPVWCFNEWSSWCWLLLLLRKMYCWCQFKNLALKTHKNSINPPKPNCIVRFSSRSCYFGV